TYFPHNSTSSGSRARADIWTKWDEFMGKAYDGKQKALAVADAADAKDGAKVSAAYKDFGKACGSCHKPFRAPKKKK
ncbi:MAG: cytochrome c, partial [Deltaproteobacteria bacterium]|nr:cytochrome c [Deltaproteobacteria bacterium]